MYLAINKNDPYEYHSFTWTQDDRLIINGNEVNTREWEIIWIEQMQPCQAKHNTYIHVIKLMSMTTNAKRFIMLQGQINEQIDTVGQADIELADELDRMIDQLTTDELYQIVDWYDN